MSDKLTIKIKYFSDDVPRLTKIDKGDWIDLYAAKDMQIRYHHHALIPLGVGMKLPEGYEAHLAARSSLYKKGLIVANGVGIIDNSYCGDNDQWFLSVICSCPPKDNKWDGISTNYQGSETPYVQINKGDKIAQFRIMLKQPVFEFEEVDHLEDKDRGGFGTTGER